MRLSEIGNSLDTEGQCAELGFEIDAFGLRRIFVMLWTYNGDNTMFHLGYAYPFTECPYNGHVDSVSHPRYGIFVLKRVIT